RACELAMAVAQAREELVGLGDRGTDAVLAPAAPEGELQVLLHRERRKDGAALRRVGHAGTRVLVGVTLRHHRAVEQHVALCGCNETRAHARDRGLART